MNYLIMAAGTQSCMNAKIRILLYSCIFMLNTAAQTPAAVIPDFSFSKQDKTSVSNKNLPAGKKIFFVFFDTECDHCRHAIQYINLHLQEFKKAAVYLISLEGGDKINVFLARYGAELLNKKSITILQDTRDEFIRLFKPRKYPSVFLYSAKKELLLYDDNEQNLFKFLQLINK